MAATVSGTVVHQTTAPPSPTPTSRAKFSSQPASQQSLLLPCDMIAATSLCAGGLETLATIGCCSQLIIEQNLLLVVTVISLAGATKVAVRQILQRRSIALAHIGRQS